MTAKKIAEDKAIEKILRGSKTIAIVGLSPKEERASHRVARYLREKGYQIIPVNPGHSEILGEKSYPSLAEVPGEIDVVDIFRSFDHVPPIVEEAIRKKVGVVWMQKGIVNREAACRAEEAGLWVIMDRCMMEEHKRRERYPGRSFNRGRQSFKFHNLEWRGDSRA